MYFEIERVNANKFHPFHLNLVVGIKFIAEIFNFLMKKIQKINGSYDYRMIQFQSHFKVVQSLRAI